MGFFGDLMGFWMLEVRENGKRIWGGRTLPRAQKTNGRGCDATWLLCGVHEWSYCCRLWTLESGHSLGVGFFSLVLPVRV